MGSPGWVAVPLEEIPLAGDGEPGPSWYPLQHAFGLTGFGANAFVAGREGETLVEEHDESQSRQQELYLVVRGSARFTVAGEVVEAAPISAIAIRDPGLTRSAVALEPGTTILAFGAQPRDDFRSTWREEHFDGVERLL
jgi:hypothetical protein